jgi:valyl-tRNA synthetase
VFGTILRLLHPVMPFVTETLWDEFGYGEPCSLIRAPWPEPVAVPQAEAARSELDWVVRLITEVRTVRSEMGVPQSVTMPVWLNEAAPATLARAERWQDAIRRLARASEIAPLTGAVPRGASQSVLDEATLVLPLAGVIDLAVERARLARDVARAGDEVGKLERKLENTDFVSRAKPEVVEENRERLVAARDQMARLQAALQRIAP